MSQGETSFPRVPDVQILTKWAQIWARWNVRKAASKASKIQKAMVVSKRIVMEIWFRGIPLILCQRKIESDLLQIRIRIPIFRESDLKLTYLAISLIWRKNTMYWIAFSSSDWQCDECLAKKSWSQVMESCTSAQKALKSMAGDLDIISHYERYVRILSGTFSSLIGL